MFKYWCLSGYHKESIASSNELIYDKIFMFVFLESEYTDLEVGYGDLKKQYTNLKEHLDVISQHQAEGKQHAADQHK